MLAIPATPPPLVRLLPGVYATGINIGTHTTQPVRFVATGATIAGTNPLQISGGANIEIRGVTAVGSSEVVVCTASTTPRSKLSISDSVLRAGSNSAPIVDVGHPTAGDGLCDVTLKTTELDIAGSTGSGIFLTDNSSVSADRVRAHGTVQFPIGAFGNRVLFGITNSVLDNVNFVWTTSDTSSPGSIITMAFNTIRSDSGNFDCSSSATYRTVKYEDNIIFVTTQPTAVSGTNCTLNHNVLYPFTGSAGTNIVADPKFVSQANHDYHLQSTSPAIDMADPNTLPDYDGTTRPQGAAADIGAFEYKP